MKQTVSSTGCRPAAGRRVLTTTCVAATQATPRTPASTGAVSRRIAPACWRKPDTPTPNGRLAGGRRAAAEGELLTVAAARRLAAAATTRHTDGDSGRWQFRPR